MPSSRDAAPHVADYELVRLIGSGSYGDVWLARSVTGAFRAIKFVWRDRFTDARPYEREFEGITRFTAVSLREPSQLALLHVGRDEAAAFFYYVMELADDAKHGRDIVADEYVALTLREVSQRRGRLPPSEVIALGVALARALASLHAAGLVHRDIKPSNVVFVGGVPKLADVGLVAAVSAGLTFVGTEGYVPPEGPGAPSADVFSLGKVLYELATGSDRNDYPRLPPNLDTLPERKELLELNEVIIRACEPDARQRFPDATALLDELLLLQAGKSVRRLRSAERRTARALRVAAVLALVSAIAGTGAWVERKRANDELALREKAEADRDAISRRSLYSAALTQAQRSLEQDEFGRARQFLKSVAPVQGQPDLRGFEWRALWHDAQGDPATLLRSSGSPVQRVQYSAAANMIAAFTEDREAILWDANTKHELRHILGMRQFFGFSDDGKWLIGNTIVSGQGRLTRWDASTGRVDQTFSFEAGRSHGSIGDDRWLVSVQSAPGQSINLRSLNFSTRSEEWRHDIPFTGSAGHGDFYAAATRRDGKACAYVLLHHDNGRTYWRIQLLSLPDVITLWTEETTHRPTVITFGPGGNSLICVWDDTGEVNFFDLLEKKWRWHTQMPMNRLTTLVHDGRTLAVGGRSGSITLVDLQSGKMVGTRRGHETDVQDADMLPDGRGFVSAGNGGDVRWWPPAGDESAQQLSGFWSPAAGGREVCASPDGAYFAATAPVESADIRDSQTRIVGLRGSRQILDLPRAAFPVTFSHESTHLWVVTSSGDLELIPIEHPQKPTKTIKVPIRPFIASASPDGRRIACFDINGMAVFIDPETNSVSSPVNSEHGYPYWVTFSEDGRLAASSGRDYVVRVWDTSTALAKAHWKFSGPISNGAFCSHGDRLALLESTGTLEVRDLSGHSPAVRLMTSSGILQAIAFDHVSTRLFLGGRDGVFHVIDTTDWREITQLRSNISGQRPGAMARAAISADGTLLVGYTEVGTLRVWQSAGKP